MTCEHLVALEKALAASGQRETFRGQAWSENCREWVYFDVVLDIESLQKRFSFGPMVTVHENLDPRSGRERGFFCCTCTDAVIGVIEGAHRFR